LGSVGNAKKEHLSPKKKTDEDISMRKTDVNKRRKKLGLPCTKIVKETKEKAM